MKEVLAPLATYLSIIFRKLNYEAVLVMESGGSWIHHRILSLLIEFPKPIRSMLLVLNFPKSERRKMCYISDSITSSELLIVGKEAYALLTTLLIYV
jgi:hypothetical protein